VVEALDIPVIGNGDITAAEDVLAMRAHTNCAGVMIAAARSTNPWIFTQAQDLIAGRPARRTRAPRSGSPPPSSTRARAQAAGRQPQDALEFRKHFRLVHERGGGAASLRERLFQIESMQQAEAIFAAYLAGSAVEQAREHRGPGALHRALRSPPSITSGPRPRGIRR